MHGRRPGPAGRAVARRTCGVPGRRAWCGCTLLDGDLPPPEVQVPVRNRSGVVVAHGDLGYERWRILVEYEGRQHAEREQFRRDVERYSLLAAHGWLTLRFADVHLGRPHVVVDRVRSALLSRGARW